MLEEGRYRSGYIPPNIITANTGGSSLWFHIEVLWGFNEKIKWTDAWGPYSATFVCVYSNLRIQQHRACLPPAFPRYPVRIIPTNIGSCTCGHASNGAIAGAQYHAEVVTSQDPGLLRSQ